MVLVNRNVALSFNTIIEISQNDQRKIKLIRKYENTRKKIINNECAILFNKTCINESLLPKYIYIYICIYWVLLSDFDGINSSNQRTICSCMIFQVSWFILYFLFSIKSIVFYEIFYNDVTASSDVKYLFTDPDEICTAYVKLNSKLILFMIIVRFKIYFSR